MFGLSAPERFSRHPNRLVRIILVAALAFGLFAVNVQSLNAVPFTASASARCAAAVQDTDTTVVESKYVAPYCLLRFTTATANTSSTNSWWVPTGVSQVDFIIVGGGGSGGTGVLSAHEAGGGGAGGYLYSTNVAVTPSSKIDITLGNGGVDNNGGDTTFGSFSVKGGGKGASGVNAPGAVGGSGGGGTHAGSAGGSTSGSGLVNAGGTPNTASKGGGGGGAGSAGGVDADGGTGITNTLWSAISNLSTFAAGGAGVKPGTSKAAASSIGGTTSGSAGTGGDAVADTGSGGGGGFYNGANQAGGKGADGVVIIRYLPAQTDGLAVFVKEESVGGDGSTFNSTDVISSANSCTTVSVLPRPAEPTFKADYGLNGFNGCYTAANSSIALNDNFTVYMTGYIKSPTSGLISLATDTDDGVVVKIDNSSVVSNKVNQGTGSWDNSADLTWVENRWYKIDIWWHETGGGAVFDMRWRIGGGTSANPTTISRSYLTTVLPGTTTLSYASALTTVGETTNPTLISAVSGSSGVSGLSGGTKTYSTSTGSVCSVNQNTGQVAAVNSGLCSISLATTRDDTVLADTATASIRVTANPKSDTDTAMAFTGTNFLTSSNESQFDIASGRTFSFEAWVKPSDVSSGGSQIIASKDNQYSLYILNGKFGYNYFTTTTQTGGEPNAVQAKAGEWQHVLFARNQNVIRFFVNGQEIYTASAVSETETMKAGSAQFTIGGLTGGNQLFSGEIDQVRISSSDRSGFVSSDMNKYQPSDDGLIAHFDFNEGESTTVYNRKPNSASASDLTLSSGVNQWPTIATTFPSGPYTVVGFTRTYLNSNGGWKVPTGISKVSSLVVAGGGAGGSRAGGGGGAGGYVYDGALSVTSGTYESITVGMGGFGKDNFEGANGTNSSLGSKRIAVGGGSGGAANLNRRSGAAGGSGGGTPDTSGFGSTTQVSTYSYGFGNNGATGPGSGWWAAGGGGGAGGAGTSGSSGSNGGLGKVSSITGTPTCFAAGGGGGLYAASPSSRSNGGGCTDFVGNPGGSGTSGLTKGLNATANTGSGGGGSGWVSNTSGSDLAGGDGASGIVVIRYITNLAPTFTLLASVDTTTAGTNYRFVLSGASTSPLTRNYKWETSTSSGSSWSTVVGATTETYTTTTLETTTSGAQFRYRVTVTDSDTAGLSISESSTAYLVINPRIVVDASKTTFTQKYGLTDTATATASLGTGSRTFSWTTRTGITWENTTTDNAKITVGPNLDVGTYSETLTVTDSVSATTTKVFSITITKGDQPDLVIPTLGIRGTPLNLYVASGGGGNGTVTYTLPSGSGGAGCSISGTSLSATTVGTCSVTVTKATSTNYLEKVQVVTVSFIEFVISVPQNNVGGGGEIGLNGATIWSELNTLPVVTSYTTHAKVGDTISITGSDLQEYDVTFTASSGTVTSPIVDFPPYRCMGEMCPPPGTFIGYTGTIHVVVPSGAITGPMVIRNRNGIKRVNFTVDPS